MKTLEHLKWRYAVKQFDTDKIVEEKHIKLLVESCRLAPSAFGLQPYRLLIIQSPETRKELLKYSYGQYKVVESSHLMIFAIQSRIDHTLIDSHVEHSALTLGIPKVQLNNYYNKACSFINQLTPEETENWATQQAYLGLGILLTTAADLRIDCCPMEGFDAKEFDRVLGLDKFNLKSKVIITLGYRNIKDPFSKTPKVRKNIEDFCLTF